MRKTTLACYSQPLLVATVPVRQPTTRRLPSFTVMSWICSRGSLDAVPPPPTHTHRDNQRMACRTDHILI